jgi:tRNA(Arg) A34 adenosine deaminase TadA
MEQLFHWLLGLSGAALAAVVLGRAALGGLRNRAERRGKPGAHAKLAALLEAYCRAWGHRHGLVLESFEPTTQSAFAVSAGRMEAVSYCLRHPAENPSVLFPAIFKPDPQGNPPKMSALEMWMGYDRGVPLLLAAQPNPVAFLPKAVDTAHQKAIQHLVGNALPRFFGKPCPVPQGAHQAVWCKGTVSAHAQVEALAQLEKLLPAGTSLSHMPMDMPIL